mmetsp:Transcript_3644/g.8481  ORF Transcript_3644/g.8481 Transcript_3644/m.8481 type:complete len:310 (-) Transcript_3644:302-1231(-)
MASYTQAFSELARSLSVLSYDFSSVESFKSVTKFCRDQWAIPAVFCVGYLAMVYATRRPLAKHPYMSLVDRLFAVWNLGLSLFSCWGFYHMAVGLKQTTEKFGLQFTICGDTQDLVKGFQEGPAALALILFCFSKIPELGDTVFLILKGKKVRFLQWYHHATVMLFCWMALATEYTPGLWFAATNYFVHSIMYMYFFLMTFKTAAGIIKPIAPLITIIQISQMVWGLIVNAIAVGTFFTTGNCQIQAVTVYSAIVMYASYFYLFSQLFFEAKGSRSSKSRKELAREISRKISEALLDGSEEVARHLKAN